MIVLWILLALPLVAYLVSSYRTPKDKNGVPYKLPPGPRGWPLIGNTFQIPTKDQEPVLTRLAHTYGEMYLTCKLKLMEGLPSNWARRPGCISILPESFMSFWKHVGPFIAPSPTLHSFPRLYLVACEWR